MESILTSTKAMLGITEECTDFDGQLVAHINSVFMILTQLGVGPAKGFRIKDAFATWDNFVEDEMFLDLVKSYMFLKVKLLFDYQAMSSPLIEATKHQIAEFEWRINFAVETTRSE